MSAIDLSQFNDGEQQVQSPDEGGAMLPPTIVRLQDGSFFETREIDNVQWHPRGLFVTGFYNGLGEEVDWLIFDNDIKRMEVDFKAVIDVGESASD